MENLTVNYSDNSGPTIVEQIKKILSNEEGIKDESKTKMYELLHQVDFVLGKYDVVYDQLINVFASMGMHDFSKRIPDLNVNHDFINFITLGLNMVNEQLSDISIKKSVAQRMAETLADSETIVLVTNTSGEIYFVNNGTNAYPGICLEVLNSINIHSLFDDYAKIEHRIKYEGSLSNLAVNLKWQGKIIPVILTVAIATNHSKIDGVIYSIRLNIS